MVASKLILDWSLEQISGWLKTHYPDDGSMRVSPETIYRSLGIFYENAVNKMLRDIVAAIKPEWCVVRGEFTPRGGLTTSVFARWPAIRSKGKK